MKQPRRRSNPITLWLLILSAFALGTLFYFFPTLTGIHELDGLIGVWLGLFICSHPAANFLDILLFRGDGGWHSPLSWLTLNGFTMLVGFLLIVAGTTRFFSGWR